MTSTIIMSVELTTEVCCSCDMVFSMPTTFRTKKLDNGGSFFCPAGHPQSYTKPRVKVLEEQLLNTQRLHARADLDRANAVKRAEKAEAAKAALEKKVHAGECTECGVTIQNLAAHMKAKHTAKEAIKP